MGESVGRRLRFGGRSLDAIPVGADEASKKIKPGEQRHPWLRRPGRHVPYWIGSSTTTGISRSVLS
jgi:hypothetical protein